MLRTSVLEGMGRVLSSQREKHTLQMIRSFQKTGARRAMFSVDEEYV
jgi:hypothetical protein